MVLLFHNWAKRCASHLSFHRQDTAQTQEWIDQFPALWWGLLFALGAGCILNPHLVYLFSLLFLRKKILLSLAIIALAACYTSWCSPTHNLPSEGVSGIGHLTIDSIQPFASPFKKLTAVKAHFKEFHTDEQTFTHLPCLFFDPPPLTSSAYIVEGKLLPKNHGQIAFKPTKNRPWKAISSFSIAKWRYDLKEKLRQYLHCMVPDHHAADFLNTLATGDVDDRLLLLEFRKVGLSHALAVSGIQFVLIALILQRIFRLITSDRISCLIVLLLLTLYFLFLGSTPPILRAYICITLLLTARFFTIPTQILNIVGGALLIELIINPRHLLDIGFQLTFLCTLGLILFTKPIEKLLTHLLPKRNLSQITALSFRDQHAYLFTSLLRKSLTTCLAAHLISFPILLFTFGSFPLLSLLYNLFFPAALTLSLLLLLLSLALGPLGSPIHHFNSLYTSELLRLIGNPPEILNFSLHVHTFPFPLALLTTILTLWIGLQLTKRPLSGLNS